MNPVVETDEPLCGRCGREGKTCCQGTRVFATVGDMRRIAASGVEADFWEYAKPAREESGAGFLLDETWERIFGSDGSARFLRHKGDGDCWFLGPGGCGLPLETRPLVCRLYPFDYNETAVKGVHGHLCPDQERRNGPLLLALLGMDRERAEGWRGLLYAEFLAEFPEPRHRAPRVKKRAGSVGTLPAP